MDARDFHFSLSIYTLKVTVKFYFNEMILKRFLTRLDWLYKTENNKIPNIAVKNSMLPLLPATGRIK